MLSQQNTLANRVPLSFVFDKFFSKTGKEWQGIDCYQEMIDSDYKNKYQAEWPGFYLEFKFDNFIAEFEIETYVRYAQDKTDTGIDL
ncbi:MAG: hypothetical protein HUJ62_03630, partial [Streptococcus gallolyticus]|nr:hypothetical protein [Streptococcus gallolyticus]